MNIQEGFTKWPINRAHFSLLLEKSKDFGLAKTDKKNKTLWVCLNPYCIQPKSRIFQSSNAHKAYAGCFRWIIDLVDLQEIFAVNEEFEIPRKLGLGQKKDIRQIMKLSMNIGLVDWSELLLDFKMQLTRWVNQAFQQVETLINKTITKVNFQQISCILTLCKDIQEGIIQEKELVDRLNQFTTSIINPLYFEDIQIRRPQKSHIFTEIDRIIRGFQSSIIVKKNIFAVNQQTQGQIKRKSEQIRRFLIQQNPNFNKVQQIASICNRRCQDFIIRSRNISLICPFCKFVQTEPIFKKAMHEIKARKKQISQQVLKHCFENHYQQIYLKYEQKKPKILLKKQSQCYEVSYNTVISDLGSGKYRKLHIIDRETGILSNSKRVKENNQIYQLQILTKHNRNMAKGRYLLTNDRKSTQFMINYVQIEVCLKKGISIQNIQVDTNSKDLNKLQSLVSILEYRQMRLDQDQSLNIKSQIVDQQKYKVKIEDYNKMDQNSEGDIHRQNRRDNRQGQSYPEQEQENEYSDNGWGQKQKSFIKVQQNRNALSFDDFSKKQD